MPSICPILLLFFTNIMSENQNFGIWSWRKISNFVVMGNRETDAASEANTVRGGNVAG